MTRVQAELDVPVEMRDGTVLRADIWRPEGPGPWPVLVARVPYDKSQVGMQLVLDPVGGARRGFITVVQDTRGRFASEGEDWVPFAKEGEDGVDTVAWAAALPGSNGRVGMLGQSYFGNTAWQAAIEGAEALGAISPDLTWSDPYDGLLARGGARELGIALPWALAQGIDVLLRRHATDSVALGAAIGGLVGDFDELAVSGFAELPSGRHPVIARHRVPELGYEAALDDPAVTGLPAVVGRHAEVAVPSLNMGGWFDVFLQGTIDNFVAASTAQPSMLVLGPWAHGQLLTGVAGEVNLGLAGSAAAANHGASFRDLQLDFFDRWLRPEGAKTDLGAPVRIFVMGINQWRDEQEWPLARAVDTSVFLGADAKLASEPGPVAAEVSYVYDPADPVPARGGNLFITPEFPSGIFDQHAIESRQDVVTFTSDPLTEDLEVTGRVRAVLFAETDGPSTDWVVRLCDVDAAGVSRNVVDGILRTTGQAGTMDEYEIDLWSTSYVFLEGHRLRVQVTSSCFPRWDRNLNTGESSDTGTRMRVAQQRIHVGGDTPTRIVLPVVPSEGGAATV